MTTLRGDAYCCEIASGRLRRVDLPPADVVSACAWLPVQQKFVMVRARHGSVPQVDRFSNFRASAGPLVPEFSFYDPVSNTVSAVDGELRPWLDVARRPLQEDARRPGVSAWAAIPQGGATDVGLYDVRNFTFRRLAHYPDIEFHSDAMWVDAPSHAIYVVDRNHVLRLPFQE